MKRLHFDYCMEIRYSVDVTRCFYTIKCIPQDSARQTISGLNIEMIPNNEPEWLNDGHGNRYIFGCNTEPHDYFKFRITGDAECGAADYEEVSSENEEMIYRHWHGLTVPGEGLKEYYRSILQEKEGFDTLPPIEKAEYIMGRLHEDITYEKGSTDVTTTAEEVICSRKGVCQDFAHVMAALLILAGCSARYVTGLIVGEGESHAWVEVVDHGRWYGFDPTNNIRVGDSHIKIGVGRNASECRINRGTMHGGGEQKLDVYVNVTEISSGQELIGKGVFSG